jgi:hypothetical protein
MMLQATPAFAFHRRALAMSFAVIVGFLCPTVASCSHLRTQDGPAAAPSSTATADPVADNLVIEYMNRIMLLRAKFEARNPGWSGNVRQTGLMLAGQMGNVDSDTLRPARKVIQREYKGWALLMVARTFGEEVEELDAKQQRINYATQAVDELTAGLTLMEEIDRRFNSGKGGKETAALYKWMMEESFDVERSKYLKAVAFAVIAQAGGNYTRADVRRVMATISPTYLLSYPPDNNPDLRWASRVPLTIKAFREGTSAPEPATVLSLWNAQGSIEQEAVRFPDGTAQLQVHPGQHFLSAVGGNQHWPIQVEEPGTTIAVRASASGELRGFQPSPMEPDPVATTPLLWIGLAFTAALVVFLMVSFFVMRKDTDISQAAYNTLHFLTALCSGFAGGFLAGEALFRWEQQLAGGAKLLISGTAGFALFFLLWLRYPQRN